MSRRSTKGRVESQGVVLTVLFEEVLQSIICKVWIFNYWWNVRAEQKLLYAQDRTIFKTSTGWGGNPLNICGHRAVSTALMRMRARRCTQLWCPLCCCRDTWWAMWLRAALPCCSFPKLCPKPQRLSGFQQLYLILCPTSSKLDLCAPQMYHSNREFKPSLSQTGLRSPR